ncbi:hypothetical protein BDZ94DRAFT_1255301 [Collybia nuda]|uniref:Cora-domain-containing protein n=1 Tax=Collybia nuda TaxID=64659 RepID=A0A9P5YBH0_9AGAR|nr:hypothetical protein BDZ94DRAFT_1255301 [Collybia nuda]
MSDSPILPGPVLSSSPDTASTIPSGPVRRHSSPSRRTGSPPRRTSDVSDGTRRRHSPTLTRTFDPNDPDARERQRTMDVDMAMQLSRARRETITLSPVASPYETSSTPDNPLPPISALSPHEEHHLDIARGTSLHTVTTDVDGDDPAPPSPSTSYVDLDQRLHQAQDTSLPAPNMQDPASTSYGLPTYQANAPHSEFNFTLMEEFATAEKAALGLTPTTKFSLSALRNRNVATAPPDADTDDPSSSTSPRTGRHRKLSQSNPHPRVHRKGIGGKMALFEGDPGSSSLPARLGLVLGGSPTLHHPSPYETLSGVSPSTGGILHHPSGHDRPYRFSFYSNALAATIHARSLSELPAEGQSFEDLFTGIGSRATEEYRPAHQDRPVSSIFMGRSGAGVGQRVVSPEGSYFSSNHGSSNNNNNNHFNKRTGEKGGPPMGPLGPGEDSDDGTWWLDIQSPTDEEMKMLSKVFSIHPLTTEDIQMEETREKIELFRNYYLVCFRSFDQDQYSPTHLEPLNMYIIVFREGILSFHFRPTPHPQNVRRRIKQLKDYINVTSDWISYALIDDITDAFGPLIQGIEYEVDSIDELVLILKETEQSDMLRRIGTCRKKVMGLLRLMGNKADVVKGLAKRCNENWRVAPTSDIGLYLSDIQDHLITMTQNLNHYEKILSRSHSNYLAQISIEMTDANNQINDVLSKLTALGTVLIPMNLVTGLWGMNVHVPGEGVAGYAWFISIIACLAAFACIGGYSTYRFMVRRS